MIEVIKDNTKEKFYTLCESCLSELTYDYEDVVINDLEFNYVPERYITCPACSKKTFAGLKTKENYTFEGSHFKASSSLFTNCCAPAPTGEFNTPD